MANEIYENFTPPLNQKLQNIESNSDESQAINTNCSHSFQIDSQCNSKFEQGQLPCTLEENLNAKTKCLDLQNIVNNPAILESKETIPNASETNHSKSEHRIHNKNKRENAIFKSNIDSYYLIDSDLKEESLCNYIKLCIFPEPWSAQISSITLSQSIDAFIKLQCYAADSNYMRILASTHIGKLKEIIISNISNTISIKSSTIASSKAKDEKISILGKNEWWNYFKSFYDFFYFLITKLNKRVSSSIISPEIIKVLIQKFCSETQEERKIVYYIIKRINKKMISLQLLIFKQIEFLLLSIIHENQDLYGAQEMLKFSYKMISDNENINKFAYNVLLPLHKVQTIILFHKDLMKCCIKYQNIHKDFVNQWIQAIIRYWPYGNSRKEILFLNELDEALKLGNETISIGIWELVIKKLSVEITSLHSGVSTLANKILRNELLMSILAKNTPSFPILVLKGIKKIETITKISEFGYENAELRFKTHMRLSRQDKQKLDESFPQKTLISSLVQMHDMPARRSSEEKWTCLLNEAKKINPSLCSPKIPYQKFHVSGLKNMIDDLDSGNIIPSVFLY